MSKTQGALFLSVNKREHIPAKFEQKPARMSLTPRLLEVTAVKPRLHEIAEGISIRPIYRLRWAKQPVRLYGLLPIPHTDMGEGRFVKPPLDGIRLPLEANRWFKLSKIIVEIDKMAVFLSTQFRDSHLDVILAARVAGQWLELYRWNPSWTELGLSRLAVCQF
jgi:hypothetical protein